MPLEPELLALMIDTVGIKARTGVDADRTESFGGAASVSARVEYGPKMVVDSVGRQSVASARIYIPADPVVEETAQIILPNGRSTSILRIDRVSDDIGPHHQEIYV